MAQEHIIRRDITLLWSVDIDGVPSELLLSCIKAHRQNAPHMDELARYYCGEQRILKREVLGEGRPNNKIVANHAKYITDMSIGYLLGDAIKYNSVSGKDIADLIDLYKRADTAHVDPEIAKDISIFGRGLELVYYSSDETPVPKPAAIDPRSAFVVYDDTVECKPWFGVHYYPKIAADGTVQEYAVEVYTATKRRAFVGDTYLSALKPMGEMEHGFQTLPLIEYFNNEEAMSDFEGVIGLMDAYNLLQSDRVNDVERFVQAILFTRGFGLDDESARRLKTDRILEAPNSDAGADAKWLVNALNQTDIEVVRASLDEDIFTFAQVPKLTDDQFAGNVSGVAMKYKLLGFDQMIKIKERYMEHGLRRRLRLFLSAPNFPNSIDPDDIEIAFTHSLPVNELETTQMVATLQGTVSTETLLGLLPFVRDPVAEAEKARQEKKESVELERAAFGAFNNGPQDAYSDDE